jgi:phospholipid transport system substrate-binding protein
MVPVFKRLMVTFGLLVGGLSSVMAAPLPPDQLVKQTIDEVLVIIRSDDKVQSGDVARITEVMEEKVAPHFDFPRMTRLAVGRPWRQATREQRRALVNEFHNLLIRTYASAFSMFDAIVIEYRPLRISDEDTDARVNTLIRLPGGMQPISVDYAMKLKDDGWKVYDVSVGGASMIINYRAIFSEEIQRGGVDGLLNSLAEKNAGGLSTAAGAQ